MNRKFNTILFGLILSLGFCLVTGFYLVKTKISTRSVFPSAKHDEKGANQSQTFQIKKSESKDYISYIVTDYERNLSYSWQFKKTTERQKAVLQNLDLNLNLRIKIDNLTANTSKINQIVNQKKLIVSFDYEGKLPTQAKVKIKVNPKFQDGDRLYLYYYNPAQEQIQFIARNLKVKSGMVEFTIDHCSDYFLTGAIVNDAVNNPKNINYLIIGLGVIALSLIIINIIQSKR